MHNFSNTYDKPIGNVVDILNKIVKNFNNKTKVINILSEYNKLNSYHLIWKFDENILKIRLIEDESFIIFVNNEKWDCKFLKPNEIEKYKF